MADLTTLGARGQMPPSDHPIYNLGRAVDLPIVMSQEEIVQHINALNIKVAQICAEISQLKERIKERGSGY